MNDEIKNAVGRVLRFLEAGGWHVVASKYSSESFGDFIVTVKKEPAEFRIIRDRSQYYLDGPDRAERPLS